MDDLEELRRQNARLFAQLEAVKKQVNDKQLEIEHCHAVCDELRQKLDVREAEMLEREAALILAAPTDEAQEGGKRWTRSQITVARMIGTTMQTRAALARAKTGA